VLGGVMAATFLGILFVPLFFVTVRRMFGSKPRKVPAAAANGPQR
jgi:multidrug efflux pump